MTTLGKNIYILLKVLNFKHIHGLKFVYFGQSIKF